MPESTIFEPEPVVVDSGSVPFGGQAAPSTGEKVAAITAEHPEYLVAATLAGGFILAKVVKRLAQ